MDALKKEVLFNLLAENGYMYSGNATFVEDLYYRYIQDQHSVNGHWRQLFDTLLASETAQIEINHLAIQSQLRQSARFANTEITKKIPVEQQLGASQAKQAAVLQLINAYRFRGHQNARLDPIGLREKIALPDLDPSYYDLSTEDLDTEFDTGSLVCLERAKLRDILAVLSQAYCSNIGWEYMHITNTDEKRWLQTRVETVHIQASMAKETRKRILERLIAAHGLEHYLHVKYVGQKRFSLEGAESLIPLLDGLIQRSGSGGVKEIVIGMAHRGRLNVLVNILGKSPAELFQEFEGHIALGTGSGDVRYHMGFSSDVQTAQESVHVTLAFNPSHLEIINPVIEGSVRARQHRRRDRAGEQVLPVLIHGDAAFAGQGVVMETLQMSQARGYMTGGTVHIVINNQIGFTVSNPLDSRSTFYCTDVAKMVQAPIFHVNGEDPEAVLRVMELAHDYRMEFKKDVVIDMVCYRRHGHNEADEPSVTQPMMYKKVAGIEPAYVNYARDLVRQQIVTEDQVEKLRKQYRAALESGSTVACDISKEVKNRWIIDWGQYAGIPWSKEVDTKIDLKRVRKFSDILSSVPEDFQLHARVKKIIESRKQMAMGKSPLDWGYAELLAYASLLDEGYNVRLSGQDSGRGTFFHRQSVFHDQSDGSTYVPLQHVSSKSVDFGVIDSLLSEEAVLGFEYGYASTDPSTLVIWEAQFGDFANGAQVVIDQFISSGEAKWNKLCGLTMFLPHGYDGQGAEHSSARLERYLHLCAEDNMQVIVPTLPSQMFHALRRQMLRPMRKPLIVMTPKSLLRNKHSTSTLEDITQGGFQNVIAESEAIDPEKVRRVIACCGKIYFELVSERQKRGVEEIAIIRVEQLYPFPEGDFRREFSKYPNAHEVLWCQEEPRNQGSWRYIMKRLLDCMQPNQKISYAARSPSASPAVGYLHKHLEQQSRVINDALNLNKEAD